MLVFPAARVRQGELVLYTTSMRVGDLLRPNFYSVETLDPSAEDDKGYQRLLNGARARRLAEYILKGMDAGDAFLPTSVFLATSKELDFDPSANSISFDPAIAGPFSVVDGQHRLEGLRLAADKDQRVLDFEVPVNIAPGLSKLAQMCHFLIVNTTQKSVDKSVEQRIYARLSAALDVEDLPSLPRWILNIAQKGEVEKAVKLVDYLNSSDESCWKGRVKLANTDAGSSINQRSFVAAIVKYVINVNNPLSMVGDFDREKRIFGNYWNAISHCIDDGAAEVLYKYIGVEVFCRFSTPFFTKLQATGNYTVQRQEALLRECLDNIEGQYAGVAHPDWWAKGGQAGLLNAAAIAHLVQDMTKALHKTSMASTVTV